MYTGYTVYGGECTEGDVGKSMNDCKKLAANLGIGYTSETIVDWSYTPKGCFVHKGCTANCQLHFGKNQKSSNNGHFSALCKKTGIFCCKFSPSQKL